MNTYKERPKRGNARKAWDYFINNNKGRKPIHMFYSKDHEYGQRWVAYYGSAAGYIHGAVYFDEIESCRL